MSAAPAKFHGEKKEEDINYFGSDPNFCEDRMKTASFY